MKRWFTFISIFLLLLFGCKLGTESCYDTPQNSYNYISKASLELTQYFTNPKFDTISFSSINGDTLIFVKTKTDSTYFDEPIPSFIEGCEPFEIHRNLEITNSYATIKGTGSFNVKHSKKTITDYDKDVNFHVIEVSFLQNHFYFYEYSFFNINYSKYTGAYALKDTVFKNVLFGVPDFNNDSVGIRGYFAPGYGLISVRNNMNTMSYEIIK